VNLEEVENVERKGSGKGEETDKDKGSEKARGDE
jgi:hypothetical protein